MSYELKFLVDAMLGKLARWLLLMGYDTVLAAPERSDLDLLEQAHREGRGFLTRAPRIPPGSGLRKLLLIQQDFEQQLVHVARELGLEPRREKLFTRCSYCNEPLAALSREEALPLVPPLVRTLETPFFRCPGCKRMYWYGTHLDRAIKKLAKLGLAPK